MRIHKFLVEWWDDDTGMNERVCYLDPETNKSAHCRLEETAEIDEYLVGFGHEVLPTVELTRRSGTSRRLAPAKLIEFLTGDDPDSIEADSIISFMKEERSL